MQGVIWRAVILCVLLVGCGENHVESESSQTETMTTISTIMGLPYNQASRCWGEPQEISRPYSGCDNAITYALDGNGTLWRFPNTCIPYDFTLTMPPNEAVSAPGCSPGKE